MHAGLCDVCRHQQLVRTGRGSVFSLCRRSRTDDRYPKYPRIPVASCPGFEPRDGTAASSADDDGAHQVPDVPRRHRASRQAPGSP